MKKLRLMIGFVAFSLAIAIGFVVVFGATSSEASNVSNKAQYPYVVREISADSLHYVKETPILSQYVNANMALEENNVVVYPEDRLTSYPDANFGMGGVIQIARAPLIHLIDGKKKRDVRSWTTTVQDLFAEAKVPEIGKDDTVSASLSAPVANEMTITIVRVQETDVIETQTIAFQIINKDDSTRYRGDPDIIQQTGQNGSKTLTYHVRREDGVEVSRKLTKTVTVAAQTKIVSHGTKLKIKPTISGRATWYNSRYNAASHLWPRGTHVRVTNPANGKSFETTIDDYMESDQSVIDLKLSLFQQLSDPFGTMPKLTVDWVLN